MRQKSTEASKPMSEKQIQLGMFLANASSFLLMVPNYTPLKWWECDMFGVTRSGYFHEFEIKLTMSDFKNDAVKFRERFAMQDGVLIRTPKTTKHELLAASHQEGPSKFWYVVPDGLLQPSDVPSWAGLQYATRANGEWVHFRIVKKAPRLHGEQCPSEIINHARGVCYFRFWKERRRMAEMARIRAESQAALEVVSP